MKRFLLLSFACILLLCACNTGRDLPLESTEDIDSTSTESSEGSLIETSSESSGEESSRHDESLDESQPDEPEEAPCLIVGGVLVTEENASDVFGDGTVRASYNETYDFMAIWLDGAEIHAQPFPDSEETESINGIYCNTSVQIYVCNDSKIIIDIPEIDYMHCFGIRTVRDTETGLTIDGDGKLDILAEGSGTACEVVGIKTKAFTVLDTTVNIHVYGRELAFGIYADYVTALENEGQTSKLTVITNGVDKAYSLGINARKITSCDATIDVRGLSFAPTSEFCGTSSASYHLTFWDAPIIRASTEDSEIIFRETHAVYFNNYFTLDEWRYDYPEEPYYYTARVFVSENFEGNGEREAKVIHNECPEAYGMQYVRIVGGKKRDYGIWVCGKRVTERNANDVFGDGTVSYDLLTNTLTLNNAHLIGGGIVDNHFSDSETVVYSASGLTLNLIGKNFLECTNDAVERSTVLLVKDELTIIGDGTLELRANNARGIFGTSIAIDCNGYLQKSGNIRAYAYDTDDSAYSVSYGLFTADYFILEDGSFFAECGKAEFASPLEQADKNAEYVYPYEVCAESGTTSDGRCFINFAS